MSISAPQINNRTLPKYPGFGVPAQNSKQIDLIQIAKRIGAIAVAIFLTTAAGGFAAGATLTCIILLCFVIESIRNRRLGKFTPNQKLGDPPLGVYSRATIKISNCATESYEWKKELISQAESCIVLSANYAGGGHFRSFLNALEKRMEERPQLRAHLIISNDLLERADKEKLQSLLDRFNTRFSYLVTNRVVHLFPSIRIEENHAKILVVDGKYFVVGGTGIHSRMTSRRAPTSSHQIDGNFNSTFLNRAFCDTDLIGEGPVALTLRNQFFSLYQKWEKRVHDREIDRFFPMNDQIQGVSEQFNQAEDKVEGVEIKCIAGGPEHQPHHPIATKIANRIRKAKCEIRLASLIFNPDEIVKSALKAKKREQIKISGYFNGSGKNNPWFNYNYTLPSRFNYDLINTAYEYREKHYTYHRKALTFDQEYSIIGSYNLGQKSANCDDEIALQIKDRRVTAIINRALDHDATHSKKVSGRNMPGIPQKVLSSIAISILSPFFG